MNEWRKAYEELVAGEITRLTQDATAKIIGTLEGLTFQQQKMIAEMGVLIVSGVKDNLKSAEIVTPRDMARSAHAFFSIEAGNQITILFAHEPDWKKVAERVFVDAANNLRIVLGV